MFCPCYGQLFRSNPEKVSPFRGHRFLQQSERETTLSKLPHLVTNQQGVHDFETNPQPQALHLPNQKNTFQAFQIPTPSLNRGSPSPRPSGPQLLRVPPRLILEERTKAKLSNLPLAKLRARLEALAEQGDRELAPSGEVRNQATRVAKKVVQGRTRVGEGLARFFTALFRYF